MGCCGFGRVVGEMVLSSLNKTGDTGDVNNAAGEAVLVLGGLCQEREEGSRHEESLGHVGLVRRYPVLDGAVRVVEQVLLHLVGRLSLSGQGVRRDAGAGLE